jgi:hypothetical protein
VTALLLAFALAQAEPKPVPVFRGTVVVPKNATHCDRMRTNGKFQVRLRNAEPVAVFQMIADATCFSFSVEKGLKATISIRPNENEPKAELTGNELFNAAIADLERQGVTVKEEGTRRYRVSTVR